MLSKRRNKHSKTILIGAAKLARRYNQGCANSISASATADRATVGVARKLVAYLLAAADGNALKSRSRLLP